MYNLRFEEIIPSLPHLLLETSVEMYPENSIWTCCQKIPDDGTYIKDPIVLFFFVSSVFMIHPNERCKKKSRLKIKFLLYFIA